MEQWFEIVSYTYPTPPEYYMLINFRPKGDTRPMLFEMQWKDKDGTLLGFPPQPVCCSPVLVETKTGAIGQLKVGVPPEGQMGRLVTAKVIKH